MHETMTMTNYTVVSSAYNDATFGPYTITFHLHLEDYTVLDSEPLYDLKGHFTHLFAELPYRFTGERKTREKILDAHKDTMTGAKC